MQLDPSRQNIKTPERSLSNLLMEIVGLNLAQAFVAVEIINEHVATYLSDTRDPGIVIRNAVSSKEPAGKPIKHCKLVPVRITYFHEADAAIYEKEGSVELRLVRLYRFACEAKKQGGLFSYEDLAFLLNVDISTVKDIVARLHERGLYPPTRGAIKDIGREPSHKDIIADLLGRGFTTHVIASMTSHSEHAISRYQLQFALVLYLLYRYPHASQDENLHLAEMSLTAWKAYVAVAEELGQREDCRPHLERIRHRFELDPQDYDRHIANAKKHQHLVQRRLEQQNIETNFRQIIQGDLNVKPRVAEVVVENLLHVMEQAFPVSDRLKPGQVSLFVDSFNPDYISGERVRDREVISVIAPLYTEEVKEIWRSDAPVGNRRARIAVHIATAVQEQGGVMTNAGLAELLHVSPATMSSDLRTFVIETKTEPFTKGYAEDSGPTLTHKDFIIGLDQQGFTGEEITFISRHAPDSRDRYIGTYRRAEILMRLDGQIPEPEHLARVLRLTLHVARQYHKILVQRHGSGISAGEDAPPANPSTEASAADGFVGDVPV